MSSESNGDEADMEEEEEKPTWKHRQEFVTEQLEPGEWDLKKTNPLYRPAWKGKAKIMSSDDFDNRPMSGFDEEFESMHDAMVTLSWMSRQDTDAVYEFYLNTMASAAASSRTTSHEYVMRLVGQKFEITPERAAAIVQLHHNEDQIRQQYPQDEILYDLQDEVDAATEEFIRETYEDYAEERPPHFIENAGRATEIGHDPYEETAETAIVEDNVDLAAVHKRTVAKDKARAQRIIDNTLYIQDDDRTQLSVKLGAFSKSLIKAHDALLSEGRIHKYAPSPDDDDDEFERPLPENGRGHRGVANQRRPRSKFVLQVIHTHEKLDKKTRRRKARQGTPHQMREKEVNMVVEHDGVLRPATVAEVYNTSWKPKRHVGEVIYGGVRDAWLDRTLHGKVGGWGRVEVVEQDEEFVQEALAESDSESTSESDSESDSESESDEAQKDDLDLSVIDVEESGEARAPDENADVATDPPAEGDPQTEEDPGESDSSGDKDK